ncbi:hypothetical protein [Nostoc sp.]|uniref:hypothetical protein n=1 Tax=Nostoc sp. TaxID=1180 RepID=UPI002FF55817
MQSQDNPRERDDQRSTPLQDLSAALIRSESAFKMFRDFSICGLRELVGVSLQGLTDSSSLSAMDLYDLPIQEAIDLLGQKRGIQPNINRDGKACSPENFRDTAWTINRGESLTLLVYGDRVVGIQKGTQQSSNPDNPN